jgi:hypothetical protein
VNVQFLARIKRSDDNKYMEITDNFSFINTEIVATVLKCVLMLSEDHISNNTTKHSVLIYKIVQHGTSIRLSRTNVFKGSPQVTRL